MKDLGKDQINMLPLAQFEGETIVIKSQDQAIKAIERLETASVIGFDTETRPAFNKGESYPVCMIQLYADNCAYIFRINYFSIPDQMLALFENSKILKVGVAIADDLKGLKKLRKFTPKGFVELAEIAKENGYKKLGLRSLSASVLGVRISKGAKLTNWEKDHLNSSQLNYAATDAWIGKELYKGLINLTVTS